MKFNHFVAIAATIISAVGLLRQMTDIEIKLFQSFPSRK